MKTKHALRLFLFVFVFSFSLAVQAKASVYTATAEFYANPTGCIFTSSTITVVQTTSQSGGRPTSTVTVEMNYIVKSVCDWPGDNLYYHVIATQGAVEINAADFSINRNLNSASLHSSIPVYDDESGTFHNLSVHVVWTALERGGNVSLRSATASLNVPASENPFLVGNAVITNPITEAVSAELSRQ